MAPDTKTNGKHAIRVALEWSSRLTEAQRLGMPRDTFKELRDEYARNFTRAVDLDSFEAATRHGRA
jgi:hypothetical protein